MGFPSAAHTGSPLGPPMATNPGWLWEAWGALWGMARAQWGDRSPPGRIQGEAGCHRVTEAHLGRHSVFLGRRGLADVNLPGYTAPGCHSLVEVRYRLLQGVRGQPGWIWGAGVTRGDNS